MSLLKNNIINSLLSKFLIAFATMGVVVITSKVLGAEGRGLISYILLMVTLAQVIAEFIGGSALINLAPKEKLLNLLVPSYLFSLTVSIGLFFVALYDDSIHISASLIALVGFLLCICNINLNLILGRKQINQRNAIQFIFTILLLSGIYYVYWINKSVEIVPYFKMLAFSYGIGVLLSFIFILKIANGLDFKDFKWTNKIVQFGFWSQLAQLINMLNYRVAYFFVEDDFGMSKLGLYGNAMTVGDMMKIPGHSLGQVQHNRIINHSKGKQYGMRITKRYLTFNLVIYLLQAAALILLPALFWVWLLGADFGSLKRIIMYLLPGFIALGLATSFSYYFHAINQFKKVMLVNLLTFIAFILSYYGLRSAFQFDAVLLAFSIAYIVHLSLFLLLFVHSQKGRFTPFKTLRTLVYVITNKG